MTEDNEIPQIQTDPEDQLSLEQAIMSKLNIIIRKKDGTIAVDESGRELKPMTAIAMSILNNAMKGDIQSATFIRNITRRDQSQDDEIRRKRYDEQLNIERQRIRNELEREDLYIGQDMEIEQIARTKIIIDRLADAMQQPDYEDIVNEYHRDGTFVQRINPLHERWDKMSKQLLADLKSLRIDALQRSINIKNKSKRK